eukprot:Phypoly_transcript_11253.p1 GENE.Phypoly_transcript_11253~~Phypoly_transcript_11253.p1  ORF type:complete len:256 (-),score=35.14 Phypoly_transcript_11253:159-926(-)
MKIEGKTFIVTGGASGLGEATVRRLVKEKANVVIVDVNNERGNGLAQELGKTTIFVNADITNEESVKSLVAKTVETFGGLNGAVNCAGVAASIKVLGRTGPFPLDVWQKIININLVGTFNVIRLAADAMQKLPADSTGERGVFINVASVAAFDGQQGQSAYSASKAAVVGMALPIAREFAPLGIRINTIAPGTFDTPMMQGLPEKAKTVLASTIPFPPRFGQGHEFAALVVHMIENSYLNAEVIRLDGGLRMPKL